MTKKFTAVITAVMMLISLCPAFHRAEVKAASVQNAIVEDLLADGKIKIADFSNLTDAGLMKNIDKYDTLADGSNVLSINSAAEYTLDSAATSLRWDMSTTGRFKGFGIKSDYKLSDFEGYDYAVKLKYYADAPQGFTGGSKIFRFLKQYGVVKNGKTNVDYVNHDAPTTKDLTTSDVDKWNEETYIRPAALDGATYVPSANSLIYIALVSNQGANSYPIYIDSVWLELNNSGGELAEPTPSIPDGDDVGVAAFDGYTLTFDKDIIASSDAVSVKKDGLDITQEITSTIIENEITLDFENGVDANSSYTVTVDKTKLRAKSGETLSDDAIFEFTASNIIDFAVTDTFPADSAANVLANFPGFESTVTFNSVPDNTKTPISNNVTVLKDGKAYTDYTLSVEGSELSIVFGDALEGECTYTVTIERGLSDSYNNISASDYTYTFTTAETPTFSASGSVVDDTDPENIKILYTSSSDANIDYVVSKSGGAALRIADNVGGFYSNTLRVDWKAGQTAYAAKLIDGDSFTYEGMSTVNYLIYQSVPSNQPFNLPVYYQNGTSYTAVNTKADANWSGWKIVSVAIPTTAEEYVRLWINVNGWSAYREQDGFFCVSDVWLSKTTPTEMKLLSSSIDDGASGIKTYGTEILFKFSQPINSKSTPKVTLLDESGRKVSGVVTASVDGDVIKVMLGELDPSSKYTLRAENVYSSHVYKSDDVEITFTTGAATISSSQRDAAVSLANGTDSDAFATVIGNNAAYFGLASAEGEMITDIAALAVGEDSFADFIEVDSYIENTLSIFKSFNSNSEKWANITSLIKSNPDFFGGVTDSDYVYYNSLKEAKQNEISVTICDKLPTTSITKLNDIFEKGIASYKDSLKDSATDNSYDKPKKTTTSVSMSGGIASPVAPVTPIETVAVFDDLTGYEWAQESIMSLNKAGIISTPDDKKFRPEDNITREEFVKLLVCAFAFDSVDNGHLFADSLVDAWYNVYLSKAYTCGISKGYPDGTFGVGEYISREDMITMGARAVELSGVSLESDISCGFNDENDISPYALLYVNTLVQSGVISGMGDGNFAPKANANRAQAAKIISQLMNIYK